MMDRRSVLKIFGFAMTLPALPGRAVALSLPAAPTISAATYKWAEVIVRAHNKCNLSMLERLLGLDATSAEVLRARLLENGVISRHANAYGMHRALQPLDQGLIQRATSASRSASAPDTDLVQRVAPGKPKTPQPQDTHSREDVDLAHQDDGADDPSEQACTREPICSSQESPAQFKED